jgi:hypothetical protein
MPDIGCPSSQQPAAATGAFLTTDRRGSVVQSVVVEGLQAFFELAHGRRPRVVVRILLAVLLIAPADFGFMPKCFPRKRSVEGFITFDEWKCILAMTVSSEAIRFPLHEIT